MNPILFVWIALLAAVFWFMILRPQRNAKRRATELAQSLEEGDEVVTIGGLYGRVVTIDEREAELEVADGVTLRFARRAIAGKVPAELEESEDDDSRTTSSRESSRKTTSRTTKRSTTRSTMSSTTRTRRRTSRSATRLRRPTSRSVDDALD